MKQSMIVVDDRKLKRDFANWSKKMDKIHRQEVENAAKKTAMDVRKHIYAERRDTGALAKSITHDVKWSIRGISLVGESGFVVSVKSSKYYAPFVEYNTRPHFPPIAAITPWAKRHGISPWAVAIAIAKKGTKGIHMFQKAFKQLEQRKDKISQRIAARIRSEL